MMQLLCDKDFIPDGKLSGNETSHWVLNPSLDQPVRVMEFHD